MQFAALAAGGFLFAKLIRLPIAHLLGPLIVSSVAHLFGWGEIPRVQEFIIRFICKAYKPDDLQQSSGSSLLLITKTRS